MCKCRFLRVGLTVLMLAVLWLAVGAAAHASSEDAVWPESSGEVVSSTPAIRIRDTSCAAFPNRLAMA